MDDLLYYYKMFVKRIIDGDTLEGIVDVGFDFHHTVRIRLARVDAWENRGEGREKGFRATERVEELIAESGGSVIIRTMEKGSFGRWLAEVILDDERNLGDVLLEEGHAILYVRG